MNNYCMNNSITVTNKVIPYTSILYRLQSRTNLGESQQYQVARYLFGFRRELRDEVEMYAMNNLNDASLAYKAERHQNSHQSPLPVRSYHQSNTYTTSKTTFTQPHNNQEPINLLPSQQYTKKDGPTTYQNQTTKPEFIQNRPNTRRTYEQSSQNLNTKPNPYANQVL